MYPNAFYRVSTKALIKNSQGHVLVVKENQDTWSLPGGGLDHGEDPVLGLRRELQEELGITQVQISGAPTVITFCIKQDKPVWLLWLVFNVTVASSTFTMGQGVHKAQYLPAVHLAQSEDIFEQMVYKAAIS